MIYQFVNSLLQHELTRQLNYFRLKLIVHEDELLILFLAADSNFLQDSLLAEKPINKTHSSRDRNEDKQMRIKSATIIIILMLILSPSGLKQISLFFLDWCLFYYLHFSNSLSMGKQSVYSLRVTVILP